MQIQTAFDLCWVISSVSKVGLIGYLATKLEKYECPTSEEQVHVEMNFESNANSTNLKFH